MPQARDFAGYYVSTALPAVYILCHRCQAQNSVWHRLPPCNFLLFVSRRAGFAAQMKAFEIVAQRAKPEAIMCSYNAAYGIPSCAHPINNALVRGEWGWEGFFISDCNAIEHFCGHNYSKGQQGPGSAGPNVQAALVQGGIDYNCGSFYQTNLEVSRHPIART